MPKKGYRQTKEHCENIHESLTGRKLTKRHKENIRKSHLGKKRSEKAKKKQGETMQKYYKTEKGLLHRKNSSVLFSNIKRDSLWRKRIGNSNKISLIGNKLSEKTKKKQRKWHINHPNKKFSNTKIEQKIADELEKRNIYYQQNFGLKNIANVDFYLPDYNVVIECDGCFYHNCLIHYPEYHKEARKADERKTKILTRSGYKVYRFWEHDINRSANKCINKIKYLINR